MKLYLVSQIKRDIECGLLELKHVRIMSMATKLTNNNLIDSMPKRSRYEITKIQSGEYPLLVQDVKSRCSAELPFRGWLHKDEMVFVVWGDS